jgi:hypothetical protein
VGGLLAAWTMAVTWYRTIRCRSLLMCYQQGEHAWDRGAIVRGFSACPDFGPLRVRTKLGPVDFGGIWNATGGDTRAVDVADGSAACGR